MLQIYFFIFQIYFCSNVIVTILTIQIQSMVGTNLISYFENIYLKINQILVKKRKEKKKSHLRILKIFLMITDENFLTFTFEQ